MKVAHKCVSALKLAKHLAFQPNYSSCIVDLVSRSFVPLILYVHLRFHILLNLCDRGTKAGQNCDGDQGTTLLNLRVDSDCDSTVGRPDFDVVKRYSGGGKGNTFQQISTLPAFKSS